MSDFNTTLKILNEGKIYRCKICGVISGSETGIKSHLEKHKGGDMISSKFKGDIANQYEIE